MLFLPNLLAHYIQKREDVSCAKPASADLSLFSSLTRWPFSFMLFLPNWFVHYHQKREGCFLRKTGFCWPTSLQLTYALTVFFHAIPSNFTCSLPSVKRGSFYRQFSFQLKAKWKITILHLALQLHPTYSKNQYERTTAGLWQLNALYVFLRSTPFIPFHYFYLNNSIAAANPQTLYEMIVFVCP